MLNLACKLIQSKTLKNIYMKKIAIIFTLLTVLFGCKKESILEVADQGSELTDFFERFSNPPYAIPPEDVIFRPTDDINDPKYSAHIENIKFCEKDFYRKYPKWKIRIETIEKIDDYTIYSFRIKGNFSPFTKGPIGVYFYNNTTNKFDLFYVKKEL